MANKPSVSVNVKIVQQAVKDAAFQAFLNASDDLQSTARDTVRSWEHKVDFGETIYNSPKKITITIKPKGSRKNITIFGYVDQGTKGPYLIPKVVVPGKVLKFQTGYSARTAPVARYNVGSGRSFGGWVSKKQVTHPGIKPRLFLKTYLKELNPTLKERTQSAINRAIA